MKERARRAIGCRLRSSVLYNAYTSWCSENGEAAASQKAFSGSLAAAGYRKVKSNGIFWTDLQLVRVLDA
jgi:putative DNA primase/helicase